MYMCYIENNCIFKGENRKNTEKSNRVATQYIQESYIYVLKRGEIDKMCIVHLTYLACFV